MVSFLRNWLKSGGKEAMNALTTAVVQATPDVSIDAHVATMEEKLDEVGELISRRRQELREAEAELEHDERQHAELMAAAEILNSQIEAETDPAKKASLTNSLNTLIGRIEPIVAEIDDDRQIIAEIRQDLEAATTAYQEKTKATVNARGEAKQAKRQMESAQLRAERAADRVEDARKIAGLANSSTNGIDSALNVFRQATERANREAEAATLKANTLQATKDLASGEDENIKAAMAAAKGTTATGSMKDRLEALRR